MVRSVNTRAWMRAIRAAVGCVVVVVVGWALSGCTHGTGASSSGSADASSASATQHSDPRREQEDVGTPFQFEEAPRIVFASWVVPGRSSSLRKDRLKAAVFSDGYAICLDDAGGFKARYVMRAEYDAFRASLQGSAFDTSEAMRKLAPDAPSARMLLELSDGQSVEHAIWTHALREPTTELSRAWVDVDARAISLLKLSTHVAREELAAKYARPLADVRAIRE